MGEDNSILQIKGDEKYVTGQIGERIEDEKGNMMWLVDFKLDFLNDIEKDGSKEKRRGTTEAEPCKKRIKLTEEEAYPGKEECSPINLSYTTVSTYPSPPSQGVKVVSSAKPNYTYTDLITLALKDKTSLTVSGIYQWITENYPYFKAEDDRWKNSVRHNLSMNPNFRKGGRAKQGSGHVWVLADTGDTLAMTSPSVKLISNDQEANEAVRKILGTKDKDRPKKVSDPGHNIPVQRPIPMFAQHHQPPQKVHTQPQQQVPSSTTVPAYTMAMNLTTIPSYQPTTPHYHPTITYTNLDHNNHQTYTCQYLDYSPYEYGDAEGLEKALGLDFSEKTQVRTQEFLST